MFLRLVGALTGACCLIVFFAPIAGAQILYTVDGAGAVWETPSVPGPPCGQPLNPPLPWPHIGLPAPCPAGSPVLGPVPPPPAGILGDIAVDRLTDIVYVTDGIVIEEFAAGTPVGPAPGTPLNAYFVPLGLLGMAPLTGMCMDGAGVITGAPTLWVTDGVFVAGLAPGAPGCGPMGIIVPPFFHGLPVPPGGFLTDLTLDPFTLTFWVCDTTGVVYNMFPFGGPAGPIFPVVGCGLIPVLQGIAYDLGSPAVFPPPYISNQPVPALYVTDGFVIEYLDPFALGALAPPTFYTTVPCNPTFGPSNGLAYSSRGIDYGAGGPVPKMVATSSGQSSSPGPTLTLYCFNAAPAGVTYVLYSTNTLVPGYICPPIALVGTPLYVSFFAPPGGFFLLGPSLPVTVLPAPIPAVPVGVQLFVQFLEDASGVGLGPYTSSNALEVTITAP
ncbi:MAG: hypothetical protein ACYTG2_08535 [Planctomycetota bacterium]|jgi:hypothetical protein